jgi:hypothetical protein
MVVNEHAKVPPQQEKRMRREKSLFKEIWSTTTRPLRLVALSIAGFGSALLAIGIIGDANDWFSSLPFLTNILSGVTSACFGIPLALVFLQWLTSLQSEELRKRSIMRLRVKLSAEFQESIFAPIKSGNSRDAEKLYLEYTKAQQPWRMLNEHLDQLAHSSPEPYHSNAPYKEGRDTQEAKALLASYLDEMQDASALTQALLSPEPQNWQTRVKTQWETLESSLRNESLQAGLNWIPAEIETEIEALMASIDIPRMYSVWDISQTVTLYKTRIDEPWSNGSIMGIQANGFVPGFASDYIKQLNELMIHTEKVVKILSQDH